MATIILPLATPHNVVHSNGIRVYLEIASSAQRLGHDVFLHPAIASDASVYNLPIPYDSLKIANNIPPSAVAIIGDVISQEYYSYIRSRVSSVCHYAGAPYGLFAGLYGNSYKGCQSDLHAVYSPFVSTRFPFFYYQPSFDYLEPFFSRPKSSQSRQVSPLRPKVLKVCIYSGKGYLHPIPPRLRALISRSKSRLISRHWPSSKSELAQLILDSDAVISFDPLSSLAYEATLLGRPCLVMSDWDEDVSFESFPVRLDGIIYNDVDRFIDLVETGFDCASVIASYRSALASNHLAISELLSFALEEPSLRSLLPFDVSAYWISRIPFLSSLGLPSQGYPAMESALYSYHAEDFIADSLRTAKNSVRSARDLFGRFFRDRSS